MPPEDRGIEMPKMRIDQDLMDRLRALSIRSGAPMTTHRRRALEQYLDREAPPQPEPR